MANRVASNKQSERTVPYSSRIFRNLLEQRRKCDIINVSDDSTAIDDELSSILITP
jgi:hypothetical protein